MKDRKCRNLRHNFTSVSTSNFRTITLFICRSSLPEDIFGTLLPEGANRNKSLVPHRGEILEINRQVPLSRPLFDGFGSQQTTTAATDSDVSKTEIELKKKASEVSTSATPGSRPIVPLVTERLPNGWAKKAVKRLEGMCDILRFAKPILFLVVSTAFFNMFINPLTST